MRALLVLMLLTLATPLFAEEVRAFWISPDWLLPGDRRISHEEARSLADRVVRAVKAQGGNTILLETLMRGQLIGPCIRLPHTGAAPVVPPLLRAIAPLLGAPAPTIPAAASSRERTRATPPPTTDDRIQKARDQYRARVASLLERRGTARTEAPGAPASAVSGAGAAGASGAAGAAGAAGATGLAAEAAAAADTLAPSRVTVEPVAPSAASRAAGARVAAAQDWVSDAKSRVAASRTGVVPARPAPEPAPAPALVELSTRDTAGALPVYPLCEWDYAVVDGYPQDLLALFIEAGQRHGVAVQAWIHCFYWKSDNESFRKPWQDGPSLWDDLMVDYLQRAARQVRFMPRQRALAYLAGELAKGFTWNRFVAALDRWGAGGFEGRFQGLIQSIVGAEGPAPDFLLTNIRGDLHYPMEMDRILALYLNPADPRVTARIEKVVAQIVASHPGLSGVHLDHVRYQKWPYGGPGELKGFPKELRISYYDVPRSVVAEVWPAMQARREAAISKMVQNIRDALPSGKRLSAAVYPTYYGSRNGPALTAEAYICQDWARWPVDYVFPMIYNPSVAYVQKALAGCRSGAAARATGKAPDVYPGVSSLGIARNWRSWAFFDFQGLAGMVQGVPGSAMKTMGLKDKLL